MIKLTDGKRERATSLILNHGVTEDSAHFERLSFDDQAIVRRLNAEWRAEEKRDKAIRESITPRDIRGYNLTTTGRKI